MAFTTPSTRWAALATRNPAAHSAFIYAVKTTNCYCRPTCPARLARRANVLFFDSTIDAAAAGFRPCKRCKPDLAPEEEAGEDAAGVAFERACKMIVAAVEKGEGGKLGLKELAKEVGMSPRYFHKVFKERMGVTPKGYVKLKEAELDTVRGLEGGEEVEPGHGLGREEFDFADLVNDGLMDGGGSSLTPEEPVGILQDENPNGRHRNMSGFSDEGKQSSFDFGALTAQELGLLNLESFGVVDGDDHTWLNVENDGSTAAPFPTFDLESGSYDDFYPFILP